EALQVRQRLAVFPERGGNLHAVLLLQVFLQLGERLDRLVFAYADHVDLQRFPRSIGSAWGDCQSHGQKDTHFQRRKKRHVFCSSTGSGAPFPEYRRNQRRKAVPGRRSTGHPGSDSAKGCVLTPALCVSHGFSSSASCGKRSASTRT